MAVYIYIMKRTQIFLEEKVHKRLKIESRLRGTTVSEVIRDSLEARRGRDAEPLVQALGRLFGIVKGGSPEAEIRRLRVDRAVP